MTIDQPDLVAIRTLLRLLFDSVDSDVKVLTVGYLAGPDVLQKPEHIALDELSPEELVEVLTRDTAEGERLEFRSLDEKKEATRLLLARAFPAAWRRAFEAIWAVDPV